MNVENKADSSVAAVSGIQLAQALSEPVIIFDRLGDIAFANSAAALSFGELPKGTGVKLKFRAPEMTAFVDQVVAGTAAVLESYSVRFPVERRFKVNGAVLDQASGLFVMSFSDRTEMWSLERMRSDFIANASHELRTPLAAVSGFIETLRGPARNDEKARDRFLDIMQAQTGRMARLIDDLLSLSRLEARPHSAPETRIELQPLIAEVVGSLAHLAEETGVVIEKVLPDEPVVVPGDRDELMQVFENLIANACKYGQDGKRVVVSMRMEALDGAPGVSVSVRDFGPGIAPQHIPRVTERFYRIDVEASRAHKGTGLGLAIVKHILARHRGRLAIRSELGKGAEFIAMLPAGHAV